MSLPILASSSDKTSMEVDPKIDGKAPSPKVMQKAMIGYDNLQKERALNKNNHLLTVIDFSLPSSEKRMWVIDLQTNTTLYHTYVSHGKNSGGLFADNFSNIKNSNQSSLGFYITGEMYYGKNGLSLRLDGMEPGINDKARSRAIVIHGAWYANEQIIKNTGRLGRSYGCPAVPEAIHKGLINDIADQTVVFIFKDDDNYYEQSSLFP